jgi:hypothetical protein
MQGKAKRDDIELGISERQMASISAHEAQFLPSVPAGLGKHVGALIEPGYVHGLPPSRRRPAERTRDIGRACCDIKKRCLARRQRGKQHAHGEVGPAGVEIQTANVAKVGRQLG